MNGIITKHVEIIRGKANEQGLVSPHDIPSELFFMGIMASADLVARIERYGATLLAGTKLARFPHIRKSYLSGSEPVHVSDVEILRSLIERRAEIEQTERGRCLIENPRYTTLGNILYHMVENASL